jgi:NAD(P)-dependent dehydrogenase (short-subunit alcohol dehydrogenase family)
VNAVAPGPVWTPLIPSTMPDEKVKAFGKDTLLKRAAQPKEMTPIYVLLASDEASYITGMIYGATGGKPLL